MIRFIQIDKYQISLLYQMYESSSFTLPLVITRVMLSVYLCPRVITLSSLHCLYFCQHFVEMLFWKLFSYRMLLLFLFNRYNKYKKRGEILIAQEFRQKCKKCNGYQVPHFDREATDKVNISISHAQFHGILGWLGFEIHGTLRWLGFECSGFFRDI